MDTTTDLYAEGLAGLGPAALDDEALTQLVRTITGRPDAEPDAVRVEEIPYQVGTPTTEQLARLRGTALLPSGGTLDWSCFVKRIQSPKWWKNLHFVPEDLRDDFITNIPWRLEIAVQTSGLALQLPDGLRLATSYRIDEYDDERATLWMEDVQQLPGPWGLEQFERAAYLLGRLSARRQPHLVEPILPRPRVTEPGIGLRYYTASRVLVGTLPALADDSTWQHPLLRQAIASTGEDGLRADLLSLGERLPAVLDALERLPQSYQHGDASPQNLLIPVDAPHDFVAIDWGFDCPQAVGFDLGQLLVGLAHAGELAPEALPAVHRVILRTFMEGLDDEGMRVEEEAVRYGYLGSLMARAVFTALPLELFGAPPSAYFEALFEQRVRLTRVLVDLVSEIS
jgi:hypothetical protein